MVTLVPRKSNFPMVCLAFWIFLFELRMLTLSTLFEIFFWTITNIPLLHTLCWNYKRHWQIQNVAAQFNVCHKIYYIWGLITVLSSGELWLKCYFVCLFVFSVFISQLLLNLYFCFWNIHFLTHIRRRRQKKRGQGLALLWLYVWPAAYNCYSSRGCGYSRSHRFTSCCRIHRCWSSSRLIGDSYPVYLLRSKSSFWFSVCNSSECWSRRI